MPQKKHLRKKLQEAAQNNFTESDLKLIETLVDDALRNHGGLTDEAIESVKRNLRPGLSKLVGDTLKNYRDDISKNIELTIATLKSDIVGFIKGVLKKAGIKDTTPTGDPTKIGWWLDKAVDSTLNAVLSFFADKGFIPTPEAIFGFGDEIAEKVTNFLLNLANFKGNIQKTVDKGFKDLGSYNVSSAPEQTDKVVKEIAKMRENNEHWRRVYETSKTPLSSALAELKKMGVLEGSLADATEKFTSIVDGILPISSSVALVGGITATIRLYNSVGVAWAKATEWTQVPDVLLGPFFPFPPDQPVYAPFFPLPTRSPGSCLCNGNSHSPICPYPKPKQAVGRIHFRRQPSQICPSERRL